MSKFDGLVLVVGATGGVGGYVVKALLHEGIKTRVLIRDKAKSTAFEKAGAEVVIGDLQTSGAQALAEALKGVKAVISAIGTRTPISFTAGLKEVDYAGNLRLINAAKKAGVEHYGLCSTMGVMEKRTPLKPFSILFYPKWQAERYLVYSGLLYTIVRPGGLVSTDEALAGRGEATVKRDPVVARGKLSGEGGFNGNIGRVHRANVAELLVRSLWTETANNAIFEILNRSGVKPENRKAILDLGF